MSKATSQRNAQIGGLNDWPPRFPPRPCPPVTSTPASIGQGLRRCRALLLTPRLNSGPVQRATDSSQRRRPCDPTRLRSRQVTLTRFPAAGLARRSGGTPSRVGRDQSLRSRARSGELAKSDPDATFLLVMSATYLQACHADIEAAAVATDQDRFMIVSAGTRASASLGRQLLPANARLQAHLGGTRQVLNVRIAEDLLTRQLMSRTAATEYLEGLLKRYPDVEQWDRQKFSDDDAVVDWIRDEYGHGRGASASRMLRALREAGRACEQKRFGGLHKQFTDELHRSQP